MGGTKMFTFSHRYRLTHLCSSRKVSDPGVQVAVEQLLVRVDLMQEPLRLNDLLLCRELILQTCRRQKKSDCCTLCKQIIICKFNQQWNMFLCIIVSCTQYDFPCKTIFEFISCIYRLQFNCKAYH